MSRPSAIMVRSTSSTAIGRSLTRCWAASIASWKMPKWQTPEHLVADHGPQLQLDRCGEGERAFGADQKMRHVVAAVARHQRIDIIAADAALHLREFVGDLVGLARAERQHVAEQRLTSLSSESGDRAAPRRNASACRPRAPHPSTACCRAWCHSAANGRRRNYCRPCRRSWRARRWRRRPETRAREVSAAG